MKFEIRQGDGFMIAQIASIINVFIEILIWAIIIRVILSWVRHNPENPVLKILYEGTEPILAPVRRLLSRNPAGLAFAPLVTILLLQAVRYVLVLLLHNL
jgi:YggT family protein